MTTIDMTEQEAFTAALQHLRRQGCQAKSDALNCAYRTPEGHKCAVGALIPDELYMPEMEGKPADDALIASLFSNLDAEFLDDLQFFLHDDLGAGNFLENLEEDARSFAFEHNLEIPEPEKA